MKQTVFFIKSILLSFKLKMVKQSKSRLRSRSRSRLRQPKRSRRQRSKKSRQPKQSRRSRHSRSRRNSAGGTVSRSVRGGISDFTKGVGTGVVGLLAFSHVGKKKQSNDIFKLNQIWQTFFDKFCVILPFLDRSFLTRVESSFDTNEFCIVLVNFNKLYLTVNNCTDILTRDKINSNIDAFSNARDKLANTLNLLSVDDLKTNLKKLIRDKLVDNDINYLKSYMAEHKLTLPEDLNTLTNNNTFDELINELNRESSDELLTLPPLLSNANLDNDMVFFIKAVTTQQTKPKRARTM